MSKTMHTKIFLAVLSLVGCANTTEPKTPTTTPITTNDPPKTENPMSAWIKDEPLKICPISGGLPSENAGPGEAGNVTNGSAFDCYGFSFGGVSTLVIPEGVTLQESAGAGTIIVKTNKTLAFRGHPPKPMSPESARKNMGLAYQLVGERLTLATYGEFSTKEGGANIKLVVIVPPKTKVERQADLNGPNSTASTPNYPDSEKDYWYAGNQAAKGWTMLKAVPDPGSR